MLNTIVWPHCEQKLNLTENKILNPIEEMKKVKLKILK